MTPARLQSILDRLTDFEHRLEQLNAVIYGPVPEPDTVSPTSPYTSFAILNCVDNATQNISREINRLEEALLDKSPENQLGFQHSVETPRANFR